MSRPILSVRDLTLYLKKLFERDQLLQAVWVRGEISNFKAHTSGHLYFTLKDEASQIKCVMFRSSSQRLRFRPDNGMEVLLHGSVSVYDRDGAYQLYAVEMEPAGVGALHLQYEQLKAKLEAEGLFDRALKRSLPLMPRKVGIITAATGAAIHDMITVSRRRLPNVSLVVATALVQGLDAPASLVQALQLMGRTPGVDVVIMGRGGGSLEDLWAFNSEELARAIRACPIPVVSAVGHETDFTIADFAADVRAPTPSAAAELVVPSRIDLLSAIEGLRIRMLSLARRHIERKRLRVKGLADRPVMQRPQGRLLQDRQRLDDLMRRFEFAGGRRMEGFRQRLARTVGRVDALSPLAVLGRGYSITRAESGRVIKDEAEVAVGQVVQIMLHQGQLDCRVEAKREGSSYGTEA
jgi:exodeoxyribonuclease VII large subunit